MTHQRCNRCHPWSALLLAMLATAMAGTPSRAEVAKDFAESTVKLPVQRVVLYSSGVGYFEHSGKVQDNDSVEFKFRASDINDLLKSMVVQDLDGGEISTVTYGSRDPISKTLQSFAIDLTQNPTLGELLGQIRGERITIDAPTRIDGTIVGVEKQKKSLGDNQTIEIEYLTLLTDQGLRRVALEAVGRIQLADPELNAELQQALAVLALSHATDKKTVSLKFLGDGEREVRVGYVEESPIWKTSYRLVLDEKGKPFLQGWAVVENTTETDWKDVRLSLVSGRPISFVMDLYSPLYVLRPVVVPELYASLQPQVYDQNLFAGQEQPPSEGKSLGRRFGYAAPEAAPAAARPMARSGLAAGVAEGRGGLGGAVAGEPIQLGLDRSTLEKSVQAAAQGADVGELFQYDIEKPVSLARQRSAMLPIINRSVEGQKVSIYNARVQAKHPLDGFELKNTSDLHLMQGPVTVFDGGAYAGDARIPDLSPGSEQLLSYALDLDLEVAPTSDARPQHLVAARIEKGVLFATFKQSRTSSYVLKNSGERAKTVLVEHPIDPSWELLSPKPAEKTRDMYRFAVEVKTTEPASLKIQEEQTIRQTVAINTLNDDSVRLYLSAEAVSDKLKDALREVVRRKTELGNLERRKQQLEQEIATIGQEQERIRNNMQAIDRNTDLYGRYVKKLTEQEDQVEQSRKEIRSLEQQIDEARAKLDEYLSNLNLS